MEKLGQLRAEDRWDLIVVDTPPSRSALDFLDAPKRLGSFLDGRFISILMAAPAAGGRAYLKVLGAGFGAVTGLLTKILGAQVLKDVQTFVAALDTMFGGFRERADATYQLLQASGTSFVVVAAPERDALREASYFVERLGAEGMPLAGLVLNRVHTTGARSLSAAALRRGRGGRWTRPAEHPLAAGRAAAARRADADHRARAVAAAAVHRGAPAGAASSTYRPSRATCTTWPACARSAPRSPAADPTADPWTQIGAVLPSRTAPNWPPACRGPPHHR